MCIQLHICVCAFSTVILCFLALGSDNIVLAAAKIGNIFSPFNSCKTCSEFTSSNTTCEIKASTLLICSCKCLSQQKEKKSGGGGREEGGIYVAVKIFSVAAKLPFVSAATTVKLLQNALLKTLLTDLLLKTCALQQHIFAATDAKILCTHT